MKNTKSSLIGIILGGCAIMCSAYGQPAKTLKFSSRGFDCDQMEFSEINSMKKVQLESLYCSQKEGMDFVTESTQAATEGADSRLQHMLTQRMISKRNECTSAMAKVSDIYTRKFGGWPDCSKMPKPPSPAPLKISHNEPTGA